MRVTWPRARGQVPRGHRLNMWLREARTGCGVRLGQNYRHLEYIGLACFGQ